ncbi:MAG TPA: hypothetical protein VNZ86_11950, partial [Bacteroidia bacterium]|nr:hypothetical protein [Bacteroidia bacterium]
FTFDPYSKNLQYTATLNPGSNYFYLMASNANGTDGKSITVYYSPAVIVTGNTVYPPQVSFSGMSNPYPVTNSNVTVNARVDNVNDQSQIIVRVNGVNVPNFSYDPNSHFVQFAMNANSGSNYVYIRAVNAAGADSKFLNVVYTAPSLPLPVINITNPGTNPAYSSFSSVVVDAIIDNVYAYNQIQVQINGINYTGFTYNAMYRKVEFSALLNPGGNTVNIIAQNSAGTISKSLQLIYNAPVVPRPIVTLVNPISNPFNTGSGAANVTAHILNVNSQSDIQVKLNGAPYYNFTYNSLSGMLQSNLPLQTGSNSLLITATTNGGSDSKSLSIIYSPAPNKPLVTFVSPASSPFVTTVLNGNVTATIQNVNSQNDIQLRFNGMLHTDFTYNPGTHQLQYNAPLNPGNNFIAISATNISGTDSKVMEITYNAPAVTPKPSVTVLTPAVSPFTTPANSANVLAMVMNVNSQNDIQVRVNGAPVSFNYDAASHDVRFVTTLASGNNSVSISASTSAGADSKSFNIIYSPPAAPRPVVTIVSPAHDPFPIAVGNITIQASVQNISTRSQLDLMANGTPVSNFNFNPANGVVEFYSVLRPGRNDFVVTGTNSTGTDRKNVTVDYTPATSGSGSGSGTTPKPVVNIANPNTSPFVTTANSISLNGFIDNVNIPNDVHMTYDNNPVSGFSFNPGSHAINYTTTLHPGANTFVISASNAGGSDAKTVVVTHNPPPPPPPGTGPVVTFTAPTQPGFNTIDLNYAVTASVSNMPGSNGIVVSINSQTVPFTYDPVSKMLTTRGHLQNGMNDIHITATNSFGSDTKMASLKVSHQISTPPVPAPVVQFMSPQGNPARVNVYSQPVSVLITGINSTGDLVVRVNNAVVNSGLSYNPGTHMLTFNATIVPAANTIEIKATNTGGSDTKVLNIFSTTKGENVLHH